MVEKAFYGGALGLKFDKKALGCEIWILNLIHEPQILNPVEVLNPNRQLQGLGFRGAERSKQQTKQKGRGKKEVTNKDSHPQR